MKKTTAKAKAYSEKKFVDDLWKTMKSQEKQNPALAILHEMVDGSVHLIGLTGGIACGKSLVSQWFRDRGIPVIDADVIAREVVLPGKKAFVSILKKFGKSVLTTSSKDKSLDRLALGRIIFADAKKRKTLEAITHPEIRREIARQVSDLKFKGHKTIILDAALLFESALDHFMSQVIVVSVDPDTQIQRLMLRDGLTSSEALKKIQSQMSPREKAQKASFVIDNSASREETKRQFEEVFGQLAASLHTRLAK